MLHSISKAWAHVQESLEKFLHGCGCSIPAAPQIPPGVTTLPKANSFLELMKMKPNFWGIIMILPRLSRQEYLFCVCFNNPQDVLDRVSLAVKISRAARASSKSIQTARTF